MIEFDHSLKTACIYMYYIIFFLVIIKEVSFKVVLMFVSWAPLLRSALCVSSLNCR